MKAIVIKLDFPKLNKAIDRLETIEPVDCDKGASDTIEDAVQLIREFMKESQRFRRLLDLDVSF